MPVENERKYILPPTFDVRLLAGWEAHEIEQRYLDDGPRLRRFDDQYLFTYKKWIHKDSCLLEIEQEITETDYNRLAEHVVESLSKIRFIKHVDSQEWVVDFLKDKDGHVYFVLAEVEMPEGMDAPTFVPEEISPHIVYQVPHNDVRFTNKALTNSAYAQDLYRQLLSASADSKSGYSAPAP